MYDVVEQMCSSCGVLFLDLALHICVGLLSSSVLTCARSEHLTRDLQHNDSQHTLMFGSRKCSTAIIHSHLLCFPLPPFCLNCFLLH